ncbi:MAG: hypothetical protein ABIH23_00440 [bacterium]
MDRTRMIEEVKALRARVDDLERMEARHKRVAEEREREIRSLHNALMERKVSRRVVPVCSCCRKIRDDEGRWQEFEVYFRDDAELAFSHGICPRCAKALYPDVFEEERMGKEAVGSEDL